MVIRARVIRQWAPTILRGGTVITVLVTGMRAQLPAPSSDRLAKAAPALAAAAPRAGTTPEVAAFQSLDANRLDEAEARFKAVLAAEPGNPLALAGMGYVRMKQHNFLGAVSFLEQAKLKRPNDKTIAAALDESRFWFVAGEGERALHQNDLATAERRYRAALELRPSSADALTGLGATLIRAQQPGAAVPLFQRALAADPNSLESWRGLLSAEYEAGDAPLALSTDRSVPAGVRIELNKDPAYLQTLASVYAAMGRSGDAQRTIEGALKLPVPADRKAGMEIQLAGLLFAANNMAQAAAMYSQAIAEARGSVAAWQGLVRSQHAMGHDGDAIASFEHMPPETKAAAMRDPAFEVAVASIYRANGKFAVAQDLLQKAMTQQTDAGHKPSPGIEMQLAAIYVEQGKQQLAYPIYQQVLLDSPDRADAWAGLLAALHSTGYDSEVVAQAQLVPPAVRSELEKDIAYLETMAAAYAAIGKSHDASLYLGRVAQYYAAQRAATPADVEIQNAWLLYNAVDDAGLYRQLMALGGRSGLTEEQRRMVQTIWTNWAARRASQAAAAGDSRRELAILNASVQTFPDSPIEQQHLAAAYLRTGQPQQTVRIYKACNMRSASALDYSLAVTAALSAGDIKDAETWLRYALAAYPADQRILMLGAKFEQARGDSPRAIQYYTASLRAIPPSLAPGLPDPGAAAPAAPLHLPSETGPQDLAVLLAPGLSETRDAGGGGSSSSSPTAALPPYGGADGAVVPPYMTNPDPEPDDRPIRGATAQGPQSRIDRGAAQPSLSAEDKAEIDATVRNGVAAGLSGDGADYQRADIDLARSAAVRPIPAESRRQQVVRTKEPASTSLATQAAKDEGHRPAVPYVPQQRPAPADASALKAAVAVDLGDDTPHPAKPPAEATDVLPAPRYSGASRANTASTSRAELAAAEAARVRRQRAESDASTGQSHPPSGESNTIGIRNAQYMSPSPGQGGPQISRPATPPRGGGGAPDNSSQQYPEPRTPPGTTPKPATPVARSLPPPRNPASAKKPARLATNRTPVDAPPPTTAPLPPPPPVAVTPKPNPPQFVTPGSAPVASPPTSVAANEQPSPLGPHPEPAPQAPLSLTSREQAEVELASLQSTYSGWFGGTGAARYRNGTPGLDRLYDVEAPVELSVAVRHQVRFSAVALPVYLNPGTIAPSNFATAQVPYLGTLAASAPHQPAQQTSSGIGGELQVTGKNAGLAVGYTPFEFPVHSFTGHFFWRPLAGHLTVSADRDPVKDTQVSYAGLRDPGALSLGVQGPIWGGVVATTGGARLDLGHADGSGASFFLSADGGVLTGRHVLNNNSFEGAAGAAFRVKGWPGVGSLTLGAELGGMHYLHNEAGLSFGEGGYFSPHYYLAASLPMTVRGYINSNFRYVLRGFAGVETFEQDEAPFYPLDPTLQAGFVPSNGATCGGSQAPSLNCGEYPKTVKTLFNYRVDAEASYRFGDHWYGGAFLSANNSRSYDNVSGGFFFRYTFRAQHISEGRPTGLFPVDGFRPLQIP